MIFRIEKSIEMLTSEGGVAGYDTKHIGYVVSKNRKSAKSMATRKYGRGRYIVYPVSKKVLENERFEYMMAINKLTAIIEKEIKTNA